MAQTELEQIKKYWENKYPQVHIVLYPHVEGHKYMGRMTTLNTSFDLNASTIGELITQGESFLRTVM